MGAQYGIRSDGNSQIFKLIHHHMKKFRSILVWLAGSMAVLVVVFLIVLLISPLLVNMDLVKDRLINLVSQQLGGQLTYRKIDILFLPKPHAIIHQANLTIRSDYHGSIASLKAFPKLLPLVNGQVQLSGIHAHRPTFRMALNLKENDDGKPFPMSPKEITHTIIRTLDSNKWIDADINVRINDGQLQLYVADQLRFRFDDIRARLKPSTRRDLQWSIQCTSNLWDTLHLKGQIPRDRRSCIGHARITRLRPHMLSLSLFPNSALKVIDGRMEMNLQFSVYDNGGMHVEIDASAPHVDIRKGLEKLVIEAPHIKTIVNSTPDYTTVSLANLQLNSPPMQLSGNFFFNRQTPEVRLDVSGIGIQADAVRQAALTLLGEFKTVQDIFNIIRGGNVPFITLNAKGSNIRHLNKIVNYLIKGDLSNGRLFVPATGMHLEAVKGSVHISQGVLKGDGLQARLGSSIGRDGALVVGLLKDIVPFHLNLLIDGDLTQLPQILERHVASEPFRNEIRQVTMLSGKGFGRLILNEVDNEIHTKVHVSSADFFANYKRIPYPIRINGAQITYEKKHLQAQIETAAIGKSDYSTLFLDIDWRQEPVLTVSSSESHLDPNEVYRCLTDLDIIDRSSERPVISKGKLSLQNLNISGPALDIKRWRIQTNGTIKNLTVQWPGIADPIHIVSGQLYSSPVQMGQTDGAEFLLNPVQLKWRNSHINISGSLGVSADTIQLSLEAAADQIEWGGIKSTHSEPLFQWPQSFRGTVRLKTERFGYSAFNWQPLNATIYFEPNDIFVTIKHAKLCHIATPGTLKISPDDIELSLSPNANQKELSDEINCLFKKDTLITGTYDLRGQIGVDGSSGDYLANTSGNLDFTARKGRIYRYDALSKILALLNITEILKGKLPDLAKEGFAYNHIKTLGRFEDGKLRITEAVIDGASMTIVSIGQIDLATKALKFTVLVAPFKTVDSIIKNLPVVQAIFGNTLISFPFKVNGTLSSYKVTAISPTAVEPELSEILNRTLNTKFTITQPEKLHQNRSVDR